jgi:ABC-2 type transport system ATP-binding protein
MPYLQLESVVKSYGTVQAVRDFSLDVERGEIMALAGPDGAGKTSIMRMICNLISPDSGTILFDNKHIAKHFESIKPDLGYMPQQFSLYPDLSVEENLSFYAGIYGITGSHYRTQRDYLYKFSRLGEFANRRAEALSGGMKQKLALSCALMHFPKLLILDEPTTGVDPLSRRQFWEMLHQLKRDGATILVSTAYMDEVARADRACFAYNGQKLAEGTPHELTQLFRGSAWFLDMEPTLELVRAIDTLEGIEARRFGAGLHIYLSEEDTLDRHRLPLTRAGVDINRLNHIEPDLEDCFIQLMGQAV